MLTIATYIRITAIGKVPTLQRNLIALNYNYRNYAALYRTGQLLSATIRKSQHTIIKAIKENNTSGGTVDTAVVGVETHINEWDMYKCRL
jgi:hypothetical protein